MLRRTFFSLTITKKEGVAEVVEGVTLGRPSVKLRDPLGSFSPGIGPPKRRRIITSECEASSD